MNKRRVKKTVLRHNRLASVLCTLAVCAPMNAVSTSICLNSNNINVQSQDVITGMVVDEHGEPIVGATISLKDGKTLAISDVNGRFSVNIAPGTEIKVSSIGFISQTLKATKQQKNIVLRDDKRSLNEVVVIGYGNQRKQDLSTSISSVKLDVTRNNARCNGAK